MIRVPLGTEPVVPLPQMTLRSRREVSTRDFVNAQQYEHWQTDGRYGVYNRADVAAQAPFYDMMPTPSRNDERSFAQAPHYMVSGAALGNNPYFQKYDVTNDPRNVSRELRGAVFESTTDRGLNESAKMLTRQFTAAYVPPDRSQNNTETMLVARNHLMPEMDDYTRLYPRVINSGEVCAPSSNVPKSSR